jgi:hypothetical protein
VGLASPIASALRRARYRVRQFTHGLRPFLTPREIEAARAHLAPVEFALFLGAEARDRRHSFDLFEALRAQGASAEELTAALLHDVGKGRLQTWHRVAFVLLGAAAPGLARRVEAEHGAAWRQALWRLRHHARLGAERVEAAGSAPRVVELVRRHTDAPPPEDAVLARFIALDDQL